MGADLRLGVGEPRAEADEIGEPGEVLPFGGTQDDDALLEMDVATSATRTIAVLSPARAARLVAQLAGALDGAHARDLSNRDCPLDALGVVAERGVNALLRATAIVE